MSKRSPIGVFLFSLFFIWFYQIYWFVQTKEEMNELGCDIPTSWLMIVPFANWYWDWKYCEAVQSVTLDKVSAGLCFFILQWKLIVAIILIMVLVATRDSPSDFKEYFRYIVIATGALSIAIMQTIFNRVDKNKLTPADNWKPGISIETSAGDKSL
jgi:hypothetical protein